MHSILLLLLLVLQLELSPVFGLCPHLLPNLIPWSSSAFASVAPNADIVIDGQRLLLDQSLPPLNSLFLTGSSVLVFSPTRNHTVSVRSFEIANAAQLWIGAEDCPFPLNLNADIILRGEKSDTVNNPVVGVKYFAVRNGGTAELHGSPKTEWTWLRATVNPGSNSLQAIGNVNWRQGDDIIVTATSYYGQSNSEIVRITSISSSSGVSTIQFTPALQSRHFSGSFLAGDVPIQIRSEVGCMTRNVRIGSDLSANNLVDQFGGHTICVGDSDCRFSNVQFNQLGQMNVRARYPVHFHLGGDSGVRSFIKNSVVRDSFQRGLVIHGTNRIRVENLITFNTMGHSIFLEDAVEELNTFARVLVVGVKAPPQSMQYSGAIDNSNSGFRPHDYLPSAYWITNPMNVFVECVAVGAGGHGFWWAPPDFPIGLFAGGTKNPIELPHLNFSNNVAHSNGLDGFHLDGNSGIQGVGNVWMTPRDHLSFSTDPNARPDPRAPDKINWVLKDSIAYKNRAMGAWCRGDSVLWTNLWVIDNGVGFGFAGFDMRVHNVVFMIDSPIEPDTFPYFAPQTQVGYRFYHAVGPTAVSNATFVNFRNITSPSYPGVWRIGYAITVDGGGFQVYQGRSRFYNVRFFNCDPAVHHEEYQHSATQYRSSSFEFNLIDADGSLTGVCGAQLLANLDSEYGLYSGHQAIVSPQLCSPIFRNLVSCQPQHNAIRGILIKPDGSSWTPANAPGGDINTASTMNVFRLFDRKWFAKRTNADNTGDVRIPEWEFLLAANTDYLLRFPLDLTPNRVRLTWKFAAKDEAVRLGVPYPSGTVFTSVCLTEYVTGGCLKAVSSMANLTSYTYFYDPTVQVLWFILGSTTNRYEYYPLTNPFAPFISNIVVITIEANCPTIANTPTNPSGWKCYVPNFNSYLPSITGSVTMTPPAIPRCGNDFLPGQKLTWAAIGGGPAPLMVFSTSTGQYGPSWNCPSCQLVNIGPSGFVLRAAISDYYSKYLLFARSPQFQPIPASGSPSSSYTHLVITARLFNHTGTRVPMIWFAIVRQFSYGVCGEPVGLLHSEFSSPDYANIPQINANWNTYRIPLADFGVTPGTIVCGFEMRPLTFGRVYTIDIQSVSFESLSTSVIARPPSETHCILPNSTDCQDLAIRGIQDQIPYPIQRTANMNYYGLNSTLHPFAFVPPVSSASSSSSSTGLGRSVSSTGQVSTALSASMTATSSSRAVSASSSSSTGLSQPSGSLSSVSSTGSMGIPVPSEASSSSPIDLSTSTGILIVALGAALAVVLLILCVLGYRMYRSRSGSTYRHSKLSSSEAGHTRQSTAASFMQNPAVTMARL